jgi:hypothetical protein
VTDHEDYTIYYMSNIVIRVSVLTDNLRPVRHEHNYDQLLCTRDAVSHNESMPPHDGYIRYDLKLLTG